jgi:hypothetical protein
MTLLLTMRAGRAYTARNLARLHGTPVDTLNHALHELAEDGKIRPCYNSRREKGYCAARVEPPPASETGEDTAQVATSVATQPVTRRLDSALTGYGSAMDAHRALAMLVRR